MNTHVEFSAGSVFSVLEKKHGIGQIADDKNGKLARVME